MEQQISRHSVTPSSSAPAYNAFIAFSLLIKLAKWRSGLCICHRRPSFRSSEFTWPYAVDNQVEMERGKGPYIVINIFHPVRVLHKAGGGTTSGNEQSCGACIMRCVFISLGVDLCRQTFWRETPP